MTAESGIRCLLRKLSGGESVCANLVLGFVNLPRETLILIRKSVMSDSLGLAGRWPGYCQRKPTGKEKGEAHGRLGKSRSSGGDQRPAWPHTREAGLDFEQSPVLLMDTPLEFSRLVT